MTATREQIRKLQSSMLPLECVPPEPSHYFADGLYMRELEVPEGMLIVGKTHRYEHFFIITKGRAKIVSEFGEEEVEAGHLSVSPPGVKRAILALEDTTLVTCHLNLENTKEVEEIEEIHIIDEHLELERAKIRGELE